MVTTSPVQTNDSGLNRRSIPILTKSDRIHIRKQALLVMILSVLSTAIIYYKFDFYSRKPLMSAALLFAGSVVTVWLAIVEVYIARGLTLRITGRYVNYLILGPLVNTPFHVSVEDLRMVEKCGLMNATRSAPLAGRPPNFNSLRLSAETTCMGILIFLGLATLIIIAPLILWLHGVYIRI